MEKPIWYAGISDSVYAKIKAWHLQYDKGKVFATRDWMDYNGHIVKKVVKRVHTLGFIKPEMDNLVAMVEYHCQDQALITEVKEVAKLWEATKTPAGPKGLKLIELSFYPEYVKALYDVLSKAKREKLMGASVKDLIKEAKDKGKDLFEV